jgi:hypothetical protein
LTGISKNRDDRASKFNNTTNEGAFMKHGIFLFILLSLSFNVYAQRTKVIYGKDGRVDTFESKDPMFTKLAASTVALFTKGSGLEPINGGESYKLSGGTYGQRMGLCKSERFREQPAYAFCSGFLVGPDLIMTAGHCVRGSRCKSTAFVFDFKMTDSKNFENVVPRDNVYFCKDVISISSGGSKDHALIRVDRKVKNRIPLLLRSEGEVSNGEKLIVIGHPGGIPQKLADGAAVRKSSNPDYFVANLDTYGGNSGSAVFNLETAKVEGILVRGETDYVRAPGQSCRISNVCSDSGCMGEEVTKVSVVPEFERLLKYQRNFFMKNAKAREMARDVYGMRGMNRPYYRSKRYIKKGFKVLRK